MSRPQEQAREHSKTENVLVYYGPRPNKCYWPKTISKCNEKALTALALFVVALPMHAFFCYQRQANFFARNDVIAVELFLVLPLGSLAVVFALAGMLDHEGLMWPAWTVVLGVITAAVHYLVRIGA